MDFDHTAVQVSVLCRRYSGDDFYRFDIGHGDAAGIYSAHIAERRIVADAYSVYFYRRSESRVACGRTSVAQRENIVAGQVRNFRLSSRKKGGNIAYIRYLQMFQCVTPDVERGVQLTLRSLCGNDYVVQGKCIFLQLYL